MNEVVLSYAGGPQQYRSIAVLFALFVIDFCLINTSVPRMFGNAPTCWRQDTLTANSYIGVTMDPPPVVCCVENSSAAKQKSFPRLQNVPHKKRMLP